MPISLKAASGGGSTPVGSITLFPYSMPVDFVQDNGNRYLRSGFIETDISKFDNTIFGQTRATYWQWSTAGVSSPVFPVGAASNGTVIIVIFDDGSGAGRIDRSTNNGTTWVGQSTTTATPKDIIWAQSLGLFVIVFNGGTIWTSPDGASWTPRTSNTSSNLNSVAWNGSLMVAVGASGTIVTSPNAITWTPRTSGISSTLNTIAFGSGVWFSSGAIDSGNRAVSSTDGINWTVRTVDATDSGSTPTGSLVHDGSKFVLAVGGVRGIYTSTNGISWSKVSGSNLLTTTGVGTTFIDFAQGQYVLSDSSTAGVVLISNDLVKWRRFSLLQESTAGSVARIKFISDKWFAAIPTNHRFVLGNGYLYAGWPYQIISAASLTSNGIGYIRIS